VQIDQEFGLSLPPDDAYQLLLEIDKIAPCMPGAALHDELPGGERGVTVTVKLGAMRFVYDGTIKIADRDDGSRKAVLEASAREKRGGGTAQATVTMSVSEDAGTAAIVKSVAQVQLTGRAAQNGRGIVEAVARRMVSEMARCLDERYGAASTG